MKQAISICSAILLLLGFTNLNAQDPYGIILNPSKGLPSNSVYDITQDKDGFIWISTDKGLSRYNGFDFQTFSNAEQTSKEGSDITIDDLGRVWYENFDGRLYYVEKDSLKSFSIQHPPFGFFHFQILGNQLFVVQQKGVDVFDINKMTLIRTIEIPTDSLFDTQRGKNSFMIFADKYYSIDNNLKVESVEWPTALKDAYKVYCAELENKTEMIFATPELAIIYDFSNNTFVFNSELKLNGVVQNVCAIENTSWICKKNGVEKFELTADGFLDKTYFTSQNVNVVFQDKDQMLWLGTSDDGIIQVPNINDPFIQLPEQPNLIVNTKNGFIISASSNLYKLENESGSNLLQITDNNHKSEIKKIWYDEETETTFYLDDKFKALDKNTHPVIEYRIAMKDMVRISNKYFAFAASNICGLFTLDESLKDEWDETFQKNKSGNAFPIGANLLSDIRGKSVAYNSENKSIYYATNLGLYKVGVKSTKELKLNDQSVFISSLVSFENKIIALDSKGRLIHVEESDSLIPFTIKGCENVLSIKQQSHYLFLQSGSNWFYMDLTKEDKATIINGSLNAEEINDFLVNGDRIILVTDKGILFSAFESGQTQTDKLIITGFSMNGKPFEPSSVPVTKYDENNVEIHYAILDFLNANNDQIEFKINDGEWQSANSKSRTLQLASLSPGIYSVMFRLKGIDQPAFIHKISFEIQKPFWIQNWFLICAGLFAMMLLVMIYSWQIGVIKRRNKLALEKVGLEKSLRQSLLSSIKSQMNPHFLFNALNTIQSYIITEEKDKAAEYLSKYSKLTRNILEMSEVEKVSLADEISSLQLYLDLEKMRFEDLQFAIETDLNLNKEEIKIPSMIVQPFVENAIKHGLLHKKTNKKLNISFTKTDDDKLLIVIDDNGIGRKKARELNAIKTKMHKSFSSDANTKRIELLNLEQPNIGLEYIDKPDNSGTVVKILLPIKTN